MGARRPREGEPRPWRAAGPRPPGRGPPTHAGPGGPHDRGRTRAADDRDPLLGPPSQPTEGPGARRQAPQERHELRQGPAACRRAGGPPRTVASKTSKQNGSCPHSRPWWPAARSSSQPDSSAQLGGTPADPAARARETERVERAAVDAVLAAEQRLGRTAVEMPHNNKGYDIESKDPEGHLWFIEVKGRVEGAETVTVTTSEIGVGRNKPDQSHPRPGRGPL